MSLGNVSNFQPVGWAESPDGFLYGATGGGVVFKWDGQANQFYAVGVQAPADAPTIAFSGSGSISGVYNAYLRFVDAAGNVSNASPVSTSQTASSAATVTYSNLDPAPTSYHTYPIVKRQLLRNTAGQFTTYYVDIETTDLTSTTLTSTNTDSQLTALTAVPSQNLFLFGVPPTYYSVLASHLGRMFLACDVPLTNRGHAQVTNGSTTVNFVSGDNFQTSLGTGAVGQAIYFNNGLQPYTIASVPNQQSCTLNTAYLGPTDLFALYGVRVQPAQQRLIYYSQALQPEAWPATNSIQLQEDGDTITGLMPFASFLYILERRHIYRFTFQTDPIVDGFIFLTLNRGCVNNRCWVLVDTMAYLMDEQGIHAFGGMSGSQPVSTTIQDVFRFSDFPLRVNWQASKWFHAVHYSSQETIRWFVALEGRYLPYHAICYNYRQQRWWIEEFKVPIGHACAGTLLGAPQVYMGSSANRTLAMWQGTLDGPDPTQGKVRGTAQFTFGGDVLEDDTAFGLLTFPAKHVVNNPISIVDGKGKGQQGVIVALTGIAGFTGFNAVQVKVPWRIAPDDTSVYQIGGIQWSVEFGWWRTLLYENLNDRVFAVVVQPCTQPALATMQVFADFSDAPIVWQETMTSVEGDYVRTAAGSPDIVLDLTKPSGYLQKRVPGNREFFLDGIRYLSLGLSGVSNQDQQRIYFVLGGGLDQGG